jgi:ribose-phosphate pyrophosphokinase
LNGGVSVALISRLSAIIEEARTQMPQIIPLLFDATNGKSKIYADMLATGRFEQGRLVRKVYGDGEIGHFIQPDLKPQGAHPSLRGTLTAARVVIVGDLSTPELVMDAYDVCNNAFDETARELTLVVPKSSLPKDEFRRQALLELFASVPCAPGGNRLALVDESSSGTPEYITITKKVPATKTAYDQFGHDARPILLYTHGYQSLAHAMVHHNPDQFELGMYETEQSDGHHFFTKLSTDVRGRRVVIVSGTIDARETLEQYYMARAVAEAGALSRDLIEAYFAYGTMERKTKSGEAVKAKIRARLLSSLPACALGNRVIFVDLHADGIPYYLEGGMQPFHAYAGKHLVAAVGREMLGLESDFWLGTLDLAIPEVKGRKRPVLCSTDIGRYKWVSSIGDDTKLDKAYGRKERVADDQVVFAGAHGNVSRKNVLPYDDKCGTGGTAIKSSYGIRLDQYGKRLLARVKKQGIENVRVPNLDTVFTCTHFVGNAEVVQKMRDAKDVLRRPLFSRIVATDSHPCAYELAHDPRTTGFFQVKSIAPLLCKAVGD